MVNTSDHCSGFESPGTFAVLDCALFILSAEQVSTFTFLYRWRNVAFEYDDVSCLLKPSNLKTLAWPSVLS